ncbi:MAG: CHAD domain-containing protein [Xanthobacteraceae bacterium]
MPQEIELKLAIDSRDVPTLRESSILRELCLKHTPRRSLLSVYYDTPSFSLAQRGIMLRVRKIGHQHVQCVKMNATATRVFQRTELEGPVRGNRPDLTQIADPDVRRLIEKRAGRDLARIFATHVERETWLLRLGRSQIECAIDRGVIACERKQVPISEVELELKSGQPARLYQLAHRLNAIVPLRIETKSKAARGYDLVEHAKFSAPTAALILVYPAMSVRECFVAIAQPCVAYVLASVNFAYKNDDPEGIHRLRVAIRRMRSVLSIFRRAMRKSHRPRLSVKLRTFEQKLGAARDWDVLVEETIASMPSNLRKQRSTEHLVRIAQAKRAEGDKSAHAALRDPQYTEILLQLASWVDSQFGSNASAPQAGKWKPDVLAGPAPAFAAEVMGTYHDKARNLGRNVRKLDPQEIHRLRIRVKKLDYAAEFFGSLWPNQRTQRYLAALRGLEDALGAFHDTLVADGLLAHFSALRGADACVSTAPVNHWLTEHQRGLRKHVIELWRRFANQKPFWDGA